MDRTLIPYRDESPKSLDLLKNVRTQPPRLIPAPNGYTKSSIIEPNPVKVAPRVHVFSSSFSNTPLASNVKAMSLSDISKVTQPQKPLTSGPNSPMPSSPGSIVPPSLLKETLNGNNHNENYLDLKNLKTLDKGKSNLFQNLKPINFLDGRNSFSVLPVIDLAKPKTRHFKIPLVRPDTPPSISSKIGGEPETVNPPAESIQIDQAIVGPTPSPSPSPTSLSKPKHIQKDISPKKSIMRLESKRRSILKKLKKNPLKSSKKKRRWCRGVSGKKSFKRKVQAFPEMEPPDEKKPTYENNDQTSFLNSLGVSKKRQLPGQIDDRVHKAKKSSNPFKTDHFAIEYNCISESEPNGLRPIVLKRKHHTSEEPRCLDEVTIKKSRHKKTFICECEEVSKVDKLAPTTARCEAVEVVGTSNLSCKNEATEEFSQRAGRFGSSLRLCKLHVARMMTHNACPACGKFCGEGVVYYCLSSQNERPHLAHFDCYSNKLNKCPHCGNWGVMKATTVISIKSGKISRTRLSHSIPNNSVGSNKTVAPNIHRLSDKLVIEEDNIPKGFSAEDINKVIEEFQSRENKIHKTRNMYLPVKQGDNVKILCMLTSGHSVKQKFSEANGGTLLHVSASEGHVLTTFFLLQAGAQIDALDKSFHTPLMIACKEGKPEIVKFLLTSGADYNLKDEHGMTCLHLAANNGHLSCVRAILRNKRIPKKFINRKDTGHYTPLVWACEYEHFEVVKYLLDRGADPHVVDIDGNIALHWGALSGSRDICELLILWGNDLNFQNCAGDTPVHIAFRRMRSQCLGLFALHKPNMKIKNNLGQAPAECLPSDEDKECNLWAKLLPIHSTFYTTDDQDHERIVCNDISKGKEDIPIQVVNGVDAASEPNDFTYTTKRIQKLSFTVRNYNNEMEHCKCSGPCSMGDCHCSGLGAGCPYGTDGRLVEDFGYDVDGPFYECNDNCKCSLTDCLNRVVQSGTSVRLQVFRTQNKGWGVRAAHDIPKGSFVSEYVGEFITMKESNSKNRDDSYYFELEAEHSYCIDARHHGNVSRFINHSCDPNLHIVKVFTDSQDTKFPRIAFFTKRDITMGEELNYHYSDTFWTQKLKLFTCNCGADKCQYKTLKK